jgi:hypothetical protein
VVVAALAGCQLAMPTAGVLPLSAEEVQIVPAEFDTMVPTDFVLREGGGEAVVHAWLLKKDGSAELVVERGGKKTAVPIERFAATTHVAAAVVPLYADGEALFLAAHEAGTGYNRWTLWVLNPRKPALVELSVTNPTDAGNPLSVVEESANCRDREFAAEYALLQRMKVEYHYRDAALLEKQQDHMEWAEYFWRRDNAGVSDGTLRLRRYRGEHGRTAHPSSSVTVGDVRYTAIFKNGVWAYDTRRDESFVLFYPKDEYGWPDKVLASGPYVLVLPSEEWALIDTRNNHMVRFACDVPHRLVTGFKVEGEDVVRSAGTRVKGVAK